MLYIMQTKKFLLLRQDEIEITLRDLVAFIKIAKTGLNNFIFSSYKVSF
jgi:hypothetical protein